ncbi:RNA pol II accessory factor, Cdc73 family [compost metagenome]
MQNGQFITTEEQRQNGSTKPDYVIVQRQTKQQTVEDFLIIDNVNKLSKEDWSRVIAVFVTGQSWQFRGWFSEDPTVVLNKIKGFHVKYTDDPVNENIAKWPVTVLDISKNQTKRHMDRTLTRIFWEKALNK